MSQPDQPTDVEQRDAEKLDEAIECLMNERVSQAEEILLAIIPNTPGDYVHSFELDGSLHVKLWDQAEFLHYVGWMKENGQKKDVVWTPAVYPRAFYYLGFLNVRLGRFEHAVEFLQKGLQLEPTSPKLHCEMGQAYARQGKHEEALECYDNVGPVGPHVNAYDKALALRGTGFVMIETGELDKAEQAFRQSLDFEPGNVNALGELQYIEHLRSGGDTVDGQLTTSSGPDMQKCFRCDKDLSEGVVINVEGLTVVLCKRCHGKLTKRWWQFWK